MIITVSKVQANLGNISPDEIGSAQKILCSSGDFYKVLSSRGLVNDAGELVEYTVKWDRKTGFSCTCPSGQDGFANVRHPSSVCRHVRIAVAAGMEERKAMAEMAAASAQQELVAVATSEQAQETVYIYTEGKVLSPSDPTYIRVMNAVDKPAGKGKGFQARPFSILKV